VSHCRDCNAVYLTCNGQSRRRKDQA